MYVLHCLYSAWWVIGGILYYCLAKPYTVYILSNYREALIVGDYSLL